ncbi:hypothetical protein HC251_20000 [Iamia sp. SCSIO 61187]|nr:hypothetical protein HC251_20000 [Iamia sp. SCSIO 61187]
MADPIKRLDAAVARLAAETTGRQRTGTTHGDCDDVVGTVATDDAIGFDPRPLLRALDEAGAVVVVMGQIAGILHGSTELTGDLDLLWDGRAEQRAALAMAFAAVDASLVDDDDKPVACDEAAFALAKVQFATDCASGDCCTPALPWGELDVATFAQRARVVTTPEGWCVRYLRRNDLITMRRAVGRPKDLRRAAEMEALPPA